MREAIERIMRDHGGGGPVALRSALRLFETGYGIASGIRNFLYDREIFNPKLVPCRIVSIGNLTVGGTGKTPVTVMTARMLMNAGHPVAVVSRGYGGSAGGPLVVSDGTNVCAGAEESGDEPLIMARELPGVPVVVGADRYAAAELAYSRFQPRVIVCDDAFQHRRLARNADIITIDCDHPYGNGHLLPRGILRETPNGLKRARAVIVTRWREDLQHKKLEHMIHCYNKDVPVFFTIHAPAGIRVPGSDKVAGIDTLRGKRVLAMSNIAVPDSFHRTLESLGAVIAVKQVAPDHHRYTADDIAGIERLAAASGVEMLVMTAKDEKNLPSDRLFGAVDARVVDIRAELTADSDTYLEIVAPH